MKHISFVRVPDACKRKAAGSTLFFNVSMVWFSKEQCLFTKAAFVPADAHLISYKVVY